MRLPFTFESQPGLFEDRCEDGHRPVRTDEPFRYECSVCGAGFWPPEEVECDVDAYANTLEAS